MKTPDSFSAIEEIQKMIHELAKGNFSFRTRLAPNDEMEAVGLLLNLLAEELSFLFTPSCLFSKKDSPSSFVFVLDNNYMICGINQVFTGLVEQSKESVLGLPIQDFISASSFRQLQHQLLTCSTKSILPLNNIFLTFVTSSSHRINCQGACHVISGSSGIYYLIRGSKLMKNSLIKKEGITASPPKVAKFKPSLQLRSDLEKIRGVHEFILDHLHEPLPSLPSISRLFLLNEYKLKRGFKEVYQTTVFKLHLNKRLAQALVLVENTPTSLKMVAYSLGFKSFSHFSKVFKEKYGQPPSYFRK